MIDLDKIEEWNENGLGEEGYEVQAIVSKGDLLDIITRLRQAEKDAERYRWLRDELEQSQGGIALFDGDCHVCDIDLFIDEAMQRDEAMQCNNGGEQ